MRRGPTGRPIGSGERGSGGDGAHGIPLPHAQRVITGGACRPGPRISLASVGTRRPNRSAEVPAHDPLPVMSSRATLRGSPAGAGGGLCPL